MADRATWKGVLKIALVTIPIKVYPATESSEHLSFHQLHETCQSRMQQKRWCPHCQREVPAAEIVKGFEFEQGRYVVLLEAELDAVKPDSTRVIDLTQFAPASDLEWRSIDRAYYLTPDGEHAAQAFAVFRAASSGKVGLGKLAIYGREYLVAVRAQHGTFLLYTLHHAAETRAIEGRHEDALAPSDQVRLARQIIAALQGPLDLSAFKDEYQVDLRRLIDAKIAGEEIIEPVIAEAVTVLDLRTALEQSVRVTRRAPPVTSTRIPGPHRVAHDRRERQRA